MNIPYRVQRRLKRLAVILLVAAVIVGLFVLCWFLWLDRYVIYTRDGASLDFNTSSVGMTGELAAPPVEENLIPIYFNEGDDLVNTGTDLAKLTGYYIDAAALMSGVDKVISQVKNLPAGTPVMLEVKGSYGGCYYSSSASPYRTDSIDAAQVDELISVMNKLDLYTIACMPAFRDYCYGLNNEQNGLPTAGGYLWADEEYRYWLNPAKEGTLMYLMGIANELRVLGFDEVVFLDFRFPDTESIVFNGDKAQALEYAAQAMVDNCATATYAVSFEGSDLFTVPTGRTRVYRTGVDAMEAKEIAESSGVEDTSIYLAFITDLYDTRFDEYSVLRPISFAG